MRYRERIRACRLGVFLSLVLLAAGAASGPGPGRAAEPACRPTPADVEGPFYSPGAPEREATGKGLAVSGRVLGMPDCRPLPDARVEWWQANPRGEYDEPHRGSRKAGADGSYRFSTDFPGKYPGRPPHIHIKVFASGYRPLTTQLYLKEGEKAATFDLVLVPER